MNPPESALGPFVCEGFLFEPQMKIRLKDSGLLDARIELKIGADLHPLVVDNGIVGLTPHLGSEFVHHARSNKLWEIALKKFGDAGMDATLSKMFDVLTNIALE